MFCTGILPFVCFPSGQCDIAGVFQSRVAGSAAACAWSASGGPCWGGGQVCPDWESTWSHCSAVDGNQNHCLYLAPWPAWRDSSRDENLHPGSSDNSWPRDSFCARPGGPQGEWPSTGRRIHKSKWSDFGLLRDIYFYFCCVSHHSLRLTIFAFSGPKLVCGRACRSLISWLVMCLFKACGWYVALGRIFNFEICHLRSHGRAAFFKNQGCQWGYRICFSALLTCCTCCRMVIMGGVWGGGGG